MNKKSFLLMIISFSVLVGCNNNNDREARNNGENNLIHVKNQVSTPNDNRSTDEIARNLVELASSVPNVNDATALVIGNVAVVGIDVNSKIDRSRVGTIKYSVAESLQHDPHGANAVIIADPDTNVRLREMAKEIEQGRPVRGIMDELSAIIGRLMPELPADIFENAPAEPTETNTNPLPKNKENKLDNEQQDQSNHKMQNRENPKVPTNEPPPNQ
jgi:YhcN/YlaJ family sporulation lipoprotein